MDDGVEIWEGERVKRREKKIQVFYRCNNLFHSFLYLD